jgi:uncharacterized protein
MAESEIDYGAMLQRALRSVVREVLTRTEREGLPGEHHFYVSLRTDHPDTQVPPFLRQRFPEEITVVLQHQFRDLVVDDQGFAVTLRFDGMPARLVVPWDAVVAFFDPTAEFGLRFDMPALAGAAAARALRPAVAGEPQQVDAPDTPDAAVSNAGRGSEGGDETEVAKVLSFGRPRDRRDGE